MAIERWRPRWGLMPGGPFRELEDLFGRFLRGGLWPGMGEGRGWTPAVDMLDQKDEIVLRADLPGMEQKEVEVTVQAGWRPGLAMAASGELYRRATTMTLGGIVAAQVGNVFACRTDRESVFRIGFFSNPLVLLGIVVEIAMLTGLIVIPPLRSVFGLECLGFSEWGLLLAFAPAVLLAEESHKLIIRWRLRGVGAPLGAPPRAAQTPSP